MFKQKIIRMHQKAYFSPICPCENSAIYAMVCSPMVKPCQVKDHNELQEPLGTFLLVGEDFPQVFHTLMAN